MDEDRRPRWAVLAADYETVTRRHTFVAGGTFQILDRNPKRWTLRILTQEVALSIVEVLPAPRIEFPTNLTNNIPDMEWHGRDYPAAVTGEWFAYVGGACDIITVEQIYLR